jgi:hypothetical protein
MVARLIIREIQCRTLESFFLLFFFLRNLGMRHLDLPRDRYSFHGRPCDKAVCCVDTEKTDGGGSSFQVFYVWPGCLALIIARWDEKCAVGSRLEDRTDLHLCVSGGGVAKCQTLPIHLAPASSIQAVCHPPTHLEAMVTFDFILLVAGCVLSFRITSFCGWTTYAVPIPNLVSIYLSYLLPRPRTRTCKESSGQGDNG